MAAQALPEVWLAIRTDGYAGTTGRVDDPFDVSTAKLFADRMNSFAQNTMIHLGPGIFPTYGWHSGGTPQDPLPTWAPKSGQKIIGAGMFQTTLKVVGAFATDTQTFCFGYPTFLDGFEASELTVDCNMRGHGGTGVCIGAIWTTGRRIRLRRIRAIDYGTEGGSTQGVECFGITTGAWAFTSPESRDCQIDDCLMEKPSPNSFYSVTCLLLAGGESSPYYMAYHRHSGIRNSVVNNEYQDNPAPISAITYVGSLATVVTKIPHGRRAGDWFVVSGALVGDSDENAFNGSFQIASVLDQFTFTYTLQAAVTTPPTGDMWIGKGSCINIGIKVTPNSADLYNSGEQGVSVQALGGNQWEVTVITERAHERVPGNRVATNRVVRTDLTLFSGLFLVTEVLNPTKLKFRTSVDPGIPKQDQTGGPASATIGLGFIGITPDAGIGASADRNRVFNTGAAIYHDTWVTHDVSVRKNYFYSVNWGIFQAMGTVSNSDPTSPLDPIVAAYGPPTHDPTTLVATLLTVGSHRWRASQAVVIRNASPIPYNGTFSILKVPSPDSFTYQMTSDPGTDATQTPTWGALWDVGLLFANRNVIEMILTPLKSGYGAPIALYLSGRNQPGLGFPGPHVFRELWARRNLVRTRDALVDLYAYASLLLNSCDMAVVERNIFGLPGLYQYQIQYDFTGLTGSLKLLGNEKPNGDLVQGYLRTPLAPGVPQLLSELITEVDRISRS